MKLLLLAALAALAYGQHDPNNLPDRQAIVHLFEWRWDDIADECERFLGPNGYAGVQVSPPNENVIIAAPSFNPDVNRPWWERYQPVSYKLETRSGSEEQFQDMVRRCNAVGVRIYVDALLNHMSGDHAPGYGTAGSFFDYANRQYDGVPYTAEDFTPRELCTTSSGNIEDFLDPLQLRHCNLVGLADLYQASENVREKLVEYLNRLISYGVAGFRLDASKHMFPHDLLVITSRLNDLPTAHGFAPGSRPFIYQEVIDYGQEAVTVNEYVDIGRVTEFKYGTKLSEVINGDQPLSSLVSFSEAWGLMNTANALVFIDNHDSQRGQWSQGNHVLTFRSPKQYRMAVGFMLSWPYGFARVMSSFNWEQNIVDGVDKNDWIGPPHEDDWSISHVTVDENGQCTGGWVCEHRWRQIANMVQFRNTVAGTDVVHWWDNGNNQIAFCRGDKGFVAMNNEGTDLDQRLNTCLPAGTYCDVISGAKVDGACTGKVVEVAGNGQAHIQIGAGEEDGILAIHAGSML